MRKNYIKVQIHKTYIKGKNNFFLFEIIILPKVLKIIIIISIIIILVINFWLNKNFNYIHIAVNFDNKYLYPCIVYLTSLLCNKAKSTFYIIHILTGNNIMNSTFDKINKTIEKFGKNDSNVSYYNLGANKLKRFEKWNN